MNKSEVLDQAKVLINGKRSEEYGTAQQNFQRIADIWSVIFGHKVTSTQVAMCMIGTKLTRLIQTSDHPDSWVDIAGYAGCGGEVSSKENRFLTREEYKNTYSHWGLHNGHHTG